MHAVLEAESGSVTAHIYGSVLKLERIYHSQIIAGQADGTLIYIDPAGHFHVVHGTGPQAAEIETEVKKAMSKIAEGIEALAAMGTRVSAVAA